MPRPKFDRFDRYDKQDALNSGLGAPLKDILFPSGQNGFLYENFAELPELFTTLNGPINTANDNDLVGLALDDRLWGGRTLAQQLAQSVEQSPNAGGPYLNTTGLTGTGATLSVVGSSLRVTSSGAGFVGRAVFPFTTVVGASYCVEVGIDDDDATGGSTSGGGIVRIGTSDGGTQNFVAGAIYPNSTRQFFFVATATTTYVSLTVSPTAGQYVEYNKCSIKTLVGNHAGQSTGTSCPVWRANSGRPYLTYDGSADNLLTPYAVGTTGLIMSKCRPSASGGTRYLIGANSAAGTDRILIGHAANLPTCWVGSGSALVGPTTRAGVLGTLGVRWNGSTVDLVVDGAVIASQAQSGSPVSGTGLNIGTFNSNGTPSNHFFGDVYGAIATAKYPSPQEMLYAHQVLMGY